MTDKQPEALELADLIEGLSTDKNRARAAIELRRLHKENETLRAQLAQPEPEPVAWITVKETWVLPKIVLSETKKDGWKPVYTSPPQREWVGLTDEERNDCLVEADPCEALAEPEARQLMEEVESKLKEKNNG